MAKLYINSYLIMREIREDARRAIEINDACGLKLSPKARQHLEDLANGKETFGFHVKGE